MIKKIEVHARKCWLEMVLWGLAGIVGLTLSGGLAVAEEPVPPAAAMVINDQGDASFGGNASFDGAVSVVENVSARGQITGIGMPPPGSILAFSGDVSKAFDANGTGMKGTPYEGWQICNGNNGSPDLRNRFLVSTGSLYAQGNKGGANLVTMLVDQMPKHDHGGSTGRKSLKLTYEGVLWDTQGKSTGVAIALRDSKFPHYGPNLLTTKGLPRLTVDPEAHDHSIPSQGEGKPVENRPEYYALAFIMRLP